MCSQRLHQEMYYREDWEDDYKRKLVSAEEAVKVVKSGDYVVTPLPVQAMLGKDALRSQGRIEGCDHCNL